MEGYTKLFRGITKSTVWSLDNDHKAVWVFLMAEADQHGNVICTVPGLAKANDVTVEKAAAIIRCFMSPDPYSGSKDFEGRRIAEIDRGWHVLNHAKYRKLRSKEDKQEYDRLFAEKRRLEDKLAKLEGGKASESKEVVNSRKTSYEVVEVVQAEAATEAEAKDTEKSVGPGRGITSNTLTPGSAPIVEAEEESGLKQLFNEWYRRGGPTKSNGRPFKESFEEFEKAFRKSTATLPEFTAKARLRLDCFEVDDRADRSFRLGMILTFLKGKWRDQEGPPVAVAPLAAKTLEVTAPTTPDLVEI